MQDTAPFILGLQATQKACWRLETRTLYDRVGHNTGNLAFHFAIDQHLGDSLKVIDWSDSVDNINAAGDIGVVPCANQLGSHLDYESLGAKFSKLDIGLVAIGLGAQAGTDGKVPEVPQGTLDWVEAMGERTPAAQPNIGVRGEFTLRVLEHYGLHEQAVILGCPTLFISPDQQLGKTIASRLRDPQRIAVAAGHQRWKHLARIEASLVEMVRATHGSYVGQSPLEMVALTRGEASELELDALTACRDYACPDMSLSDFAQWTKLFGHVFFDVPAWMEHYRRYDFVVGTRIHGIMLALQAGVPALCIAHDSRTIELCQTMKVPYVLASQVAKGLRREDLIPLMNFDPDAFDKNRCQLAKRYSDFLLSNNLSPIKVVQDLGEGGK